MVFSESVEETVLLQWYMGENVFATFTHANLGLPSGICFLREKTFYYINFSEFQDFLSL